MKILLVIVLGARVAAAAPYAGYCAVESSSSFAPPERKVQIWKQGRIDATIDANGTRTDYSYQDGKLVRVASPAHVQELQYDTAGREARVTIDGQTIVTEWDAHGPVRRAAWNGWETRFSYDGQGKPIAEVERDDDGRVRRRIRRWFDGKRLIRVATFVRGERCDAEKLSYDAHGRKARSVVRDCDGHVEHVQYKYGPNTVETWEADDGGAWRLARRETFDAHGRLLVREELAHGGLVERFEWSYDDQGNVLAHNWRNLRTGAQQRLVYDYDCWRSNTP
jgi:YD repeat-containing protein